MPTNIRYLEEDGATPTVASAESLGQLVSSPSATVFGTPVKIALENVSDRALGASPFAGALLTRDQPGINDGILFIFTAEDPNGTLSKPWGAGVDGASRPNGAPTVSDDDPYPYDGIWTAAGPYGVVITALSAGLGEEPYGIGGETPASVEAVFDVDDPYIVKRYDWVRVPDAVGYRVYRTDVPGTFGAYTLVTEILDGNITFFLDDGAPTGAGTPPLDNTTGATSPYTPYGDAPDSDAFTSAEKVIASAPEGLSVGQQWFFWLIAKASAGSTSLGNTRLVRVRLKEV